MSANAVDEDRLGVEMVGSGSKTFHDPLTRSLTANTDRERRKA
jgi:hypothetical protein